MSRYAHAQSAHQVSAVVLLCASALSTQASPMVEVVRLKGCLIWTTCRPAGRGDGVLARHSLPAGPALGAARALPRGPAGRLPARALHARLRRRARGRAGRARGRRRRRVPGLPGAALRHPGLGLQVQRAAAPCERLHAVTKGLGNMDHPRPCSLVKRPCQYAVQCCKSWGCNKGGV